MITRRRSTPSCPKIACWARPERPAAQVCVEIGTPVAFWASADARRMFSMTGVTPAVSVAHLRMAALTPLPPMPWLMSRMNRSATASTPWALKYRCGIHQTPVATITWTRERRATSRIRPMSRPRSTVVRSTIVRIPRVCRSAIFRSAIARIPARSQRCGQFSCTPGERVTMCSCISVAPSSAVGTDPSAVSTVAVMPILLSRDRAHEALDLGLVVVVVDAGANEGVEAARGQVELRGAGLGVGDVDVHGPETPARGLRLLAGLEKRHDPALLDAQVVGGQPRPLRQ